MNSLQKDLAKWLGSAVYRYDSRDQLLWAAASWLAARSPGGVADANVLFYAQKVVLKNESFSLPACRSAISRLAKARSSATHFLPAAARAARQTVGLCLAPLDLPRGQSATARRAIAVIGMTSIAEQERVPTMAHVIVSARWLALQLNVTPAGAAKVINQLVSAGVLVGEKKLRDGRTRAFRLRPLSKVERLAAELAWRQDSDELLAFVVSSVTPTPGSVADVLGSAASPMWTAANVPAGAWAVVLADVAKTQARESRIVGREVAGTAWLPPRRRRTLGGELESIYGWPKQVGGPVKPAEARRWLAERPAGQPLVEWLAATAEETGVAASAAARADVAARERRARRKAADAATGGVREWRTPEETAVAVLGRLGEPPADVGAAKTWLPRAASAAEQIGSRATGAQRAALEDAVRRVLVRAGMESDRAAEGARRAEGRIWRSPRIGLLVTRNREDEIESACDCGPEDCALPPASARTLRVSAGAIADVAYVILTGMPTEQLVAARARDVALAALLDRYGISVRVWDAAVTTAAAHLREQAMAEAEARFREAAEGRA